MVGSDKRKIEIIDIYLEHGLEEVKRRYPTITTEETIARYIRYCRAKGLIGDNVSTAEDRGKELVDGHPCELDLNDSTGRGHLSLISSKVKTVEDALEYANIDTDIWEAYRSKINHWDVTMKSQDGQPKTVTNYQITVFLQKKKPSFILDGIKLYLEEIKKRSPIVKRKKYAVSKDPHLIIIGIFDHHLGKLAYGDQTGIDWNNELAKVSYIDAFMELLTKAETLHGANNIDEIHIPLGQDFFHIDDSSNTTPIGKNSLEVDGHFAQIFSLGVNTLAKAIKEASKIARVKVTFSPGNHDLTSSYALCMCLENRFYNDKNVIVDSSITFRKAFTYGVTFFGLTHWLRKDVNTVPTIFSTDPQFSKMWGNAKYREILTGHYHKKDEVSFTPLLTDYGVVVRRLPSLTGTDFWHYRHAFVNNIRMAECYTYNKNDGPAGYFPSIYKGE